MTNAEHFEKEKTSFNEVLRIFNDQKDNGFESFDEFLNANWIARKYAVGDIVVLQLNYETKNLGWKHSVVFEIVDIDIDIDIRVAVYGVKHLTPDGPSAVGSVRFLPTAFLDCNSSLY